MLQSFIDFGSDVFESQRPVEDYLLRLRVWIEAKISDALGLVAVLDFWRVAQIPTNENGVGWHISQ